MKVENLLFSLIVVFVAIVVLAIIGWGISFTFIDKLANVDGTKLSDARLFFARTIVGVIFMGLMNGFYKIWELFLFCMCNAPVEDKPV